MTEPTDLALLDLWRAGDTTAGEALFQRHFDSIYGFFETKCEADADELPQATFLACLRARDQFRKESSFRTYLDKPRVDAHWTSAGSIEFGPNVYAQIQGHCASPIPQCSGNTLETEGYHLLTATVPYQPWP